MTLKGDAQRVHQHYCMTHGILNSDIENKQTEDRRIRIAVLPLQSVPKY